MTKDDLAEIVGGFLAMMAEDEDKQAGEEQRVHEYMGCVIRLTSERRPEADRWTPSAIVAVRRGAVLEEHPLRWHDAPKDSADEADRFALRAAVKWIHEHV